MTCPAVRSIGVTPNFYLAVVDNLLRHPGDAPSIGLLLCRTQNRMVAEYAPRGVDRPLGVSTYALAGALPQELWGQWPSVKELERELEGLRGQRDDASGQCGEPPPGQGQS